MHLFTQVVLMHLMMATCISCDLESFLPPEVVYSQFDAYFSLETTLILAS